MTRSASVFFSLLFLVCINSRSFSQKGKAGKIITTNGVMTGYVSVDHEIASSLSPFKKSGTPQLIYFSPDNSSQFEELSKDSVLSVQLDNGKHYEVKPISIAVIGNDYPQRAQEHYTDRRAQLKGKVILEKLVDNKLSLYQFTDRYGYDHFFYNTKDDAALIYLPKKSYSKNGKFFEDDHWKNLLHHLAEISGCTGHNAIIHAVYSKGSLRKAFEKLNGCLK